MAKDKPRMAVAQIDGVKESDLVKVKLAHPITRKEDKQRLGLDTDQNYIVGQDVKVRSGDAQTLINAGYTQTDPEDNAAVAEVIGEPTADPDAEARMTSTDSPPAAPSTPRGKTS